MGIRKQVRHGLGLAAAVAVLSLAPRHAAAQGCVASRMEAPSCSTVRSGVETEVLESYNLPKKHWQLEFGYRGYRSHRHFVGSVEQNAENVANGTAERDRAATEVINHVNIPDLNLTYGATDRLSLSAYLPFFTAHRRSPVSGSRPSYVTRASGFSDLILAARYWVANPTKRGDQNLPVGFGVKLPTGNDRAEDDFLVRVDQATGTRITDRRPVDQSIQPGDGGYGLVAEVQAFKALGKFTTFGSGSYLSNPQEQNDF